MERIGTAQQSSVDRDEAVEAFKKWLDQQVIVARVALKGKKRLLALLGLRWGRGVFSRSRPPLSSCGDQRYGQ